MHQHPAPHLDAHSRPSPVKRAHTPLTAAEHVELSLDCFETRLVDASLQHALGRARLEDLPHLRSIGRQLRTSIALWRQGLHPGGAPVTTSLVLSGAEVPVLIKSITAWRERLLAQVDADGAALMDELLERVVAARSSAVQRLHSR